MKRRCVMLGQLANERLLDPSPAAVARLERAIRSALDTSEFKVAKRLLKYRWQLCEKLNDPVVVRATFEQLHDDMDWAIANPEKAAERLRPGP